MSLFDQALGAEYARNNYNKQARKATKQINKTINQYGNRERQYQDVVDRQQATLKKQQSIIKRQQATGERYIAEAKQVQADLEHRILALKIEVEEYQELHAQNKALYSKLYNKHNELLELDKQLAVKAQSIEDENRLLNDKLLNALEANNELQQSINNIQVDYETALAKIEILEQQLTGDGDE